MAIRKHISNLAAALACVLAVSCAKNSTESSGAATKRAFDAWVYVHYPQAVPVGSGVYIIEDAPGTGEEVADSAYLFIEYEQRKMEDSSLVSYTSEKLAKQMGTYTPAGNYGPTLMRLARGNASQGVIDMLTGGGKDRMRIGGRRTAIIPGWLTSTSTYYDDGDGSRYVDNVSGDNTIYSIAVTDHTKDIMKWQVDRIEEYMESHGIAKEDTTGHYGLYYWRNKAREASRGVKVLDDVSFPSDTTIYINYVGRLLSGKVFDTNISDTAKVWDIFSTSSSYTPSAVIWNADSTAITLGGNKVISGFSRTLWRMHPYESGIGLFTSDYGYGTSGSGDAIRAYTPLVFEIDIVDKPSN